MDPTVKRILKASGLAIVLGRIVIPSDLITELIQRSTNGSDVITDLQLRLVEGVATLCGTVRVLGNPMTVATKVGVAAARLNEREFYLQLALLRKPQLVDDGVDSLLDRIVEKASDAALTSLQPRELVRLIAATAPAVLSAQEHLMTIDFDAIGAVRHGVEADTAVGRPRDLITVRKARVRHSGLVIAADWHPLRAMRALLRTLFSRERRLRFL